MFYLKGFLSDFNIPIKSQHDILQYTFLLVEAALVKLQEYSYCIRSFCRRDWLISHLPCLFLIKRAIMAEELLA